MPNRNPSKKTKQGATGNKVTQKNSGKFKQQNLIRPSTFTSAKDDDGNGLVDGSEKTAYQLYNSGNPLFISTKSGKTFSNKTSTKWSILAAVPEKQGHLALVNNNQSRKIKHRVWEINAQGIIQSKGRWLSERALGSQGYEASFGIDFNGDGVIEADALVDAGDASYVLSGTAAVGERLKVQRKADDPDGNGKAAITWQSSSKSGGWTTIGTKKSLKVPTNLDGSQIRARIDYVDSDGFKETVFTPALDIPYVDAGNASYVISGTAAVGEILKLEQKSNDPDGNGNPIIKWQSSSGGDNWTTIGTLSTLKVPSSLDGSQIRAQIDYTDGDGFDETVFTNSLTIPYVDDGDAAFLITGTPEVGQTLSITKSDNDPDGDGDGTRSISWLQSTDGVNWSPSSSESSFNIPHDLEGHRIVATVDYTDGQGFAESIDTNILTIPYIDDGDAAFLITGTPEVGETLSVTRSINDPDGDGSPSISWLQSTDGVNWSRISSESTFNIPHELEGHRIVATVDYTDGQGFDESINTDALTIPYVDDGDATFLIQGTPRVGQTLSIARSSTDPDGDGDGAMEISWQASLDGMTWWEVSTSDQLAITSEIAGHQLNALVQYTDGQGFKESISTEIVSVPGVPGLDPDGNDDYGDSPSTSGRLTVNNSALGELGDPGDRDWFAIDLTAGVRYQFNLEGDSLADPFLYLRNASSSLIDYNDDKSGSSLNSQITFTADTSGTHYLDVGSYYDAYTGTYTLSATTLNAPNPGFSSSDGYGHVNAQRAFEQLLGVSLDSVDALGGNLWGLDNVNAPEVWGGGGSFSGATGSGSTVAVIDTGVDLDHPEFTGRIVGGYDFVDGDSTADDGNGHGTHVAGTIAGANDGNGITGVAYDANIMPLRVLDDDGYGWTSDIISAVRWAADRGADVINMSLGGGGYSQAMADAISYATGQGSVVVMAAGNSGGSSPDYPAAHAINQGIAVGAVDQNRALAGFSNRAGSTELDYVTAPGVNIYSAVPGGGYSNANGTSMAAPHVAGVAGLLKGHDRNLSPSSIEDLLTGSASNSSASSSVSNSRASGAWRSQDTITAQTLSDFQDHELSGTLIASIDGNSKERRSTLRQLKRGVRNNNAAYNGLDHVEVVDGSRNSFAVLELSDARTVDQRSLLSNLLASDQFHYFEVEQKFSIV